MVANNWPGEEFIPCSGCIINHPCSESIKFRERKISSLLLLSAGTGADCHDCPPLLVRKTVTLEPFSADVATQAVLASRNAEIVSRGLAIFSEIKFLPTGVVQC